MPATQRFGYFKHSGFVLAQRQLSAVNGTSSSSNYVG
jgi:hypothetical protein